MHTTPKLMTIQTVLMQGAAVRTPARFSLAAAAMAAATWSQQIALADDNHLNPTVVTATRSETKLDDTLADVRVITQAQISNFAGRSLAEVLQRLAGVQMTSNGGRGNSQSVSIRGSKQVILLVDGVRFGSATAGDPSLQSLPVEQIERIEVVHGPASALYGSDAIGGVIQVFTKQGKGTTKAFVPQANASWGSAGYKDANAGFVGAQHGWSYSVNISRVIDPGFSSTNGKSSAYSYNPDVDKFNQTALTASLGYALNEFWRIDTHFLQAQSYSEFDNGLQKDAWLDATASTRSLKISGQISPVWKTGISLARSQDEQRNFYKTIETGFLSVDAYNTTQDELQWSNEIKTAAGVIVAGFDRLAQKIDTSTQFDKDKRTTNAFYLGINGSHDKHSWQLNLRHDKNSQYGGYNTWGLTYGYEIVDGLKVHIGRASSLKAPTFNDLYYPLSGNPQLEPEHAKGNEFGLAWNSGIHTAKLIRYDNKVQNLIAWAPDSTGNWKPSNVDKARLKGWSLQYAADLGDWNLGANYERLSAKDGEGLKIYNRAKDQFTATFDTNWGGWKFGGSVLYVSKRQRSAAAYLPSYTTVDAFAEYHIAKDWKLQARIANLANETYETVYGYNQRGRAGYLTLKWAPK